ncbi:hypothetical protein [Lapillicoccus jejuensis]|uniref:Uncharacterized protein n=1 Tax=Lapillicoccus jejuensis TaxID=402171 RepID=A0A542DZ84_9MICO|nr:hypothetical protein [Lapillicoccus jejuensis]TQJ08402.1 hypothetical protein FB458_1490 [Lapillicoccus jejuensis]
MCDEATQECRDLLSDHLGGRTLKAALRLQRLGRPRRRDLLRAGAAAAGAALLLQGRTRPVRAAVPAARRGTAGQLVLPDGTSSRRHAMHVHASGSEGTGSATAQTALAEQAGCDALWLTDHDWRLFALPPDTRLPRGYDFTALSAGGWTWTPYAKGRVTTSRAAVVTAASGPVLDLAVTARAKGATYGVVVSTVGNQLEGSIVGRQVELPFTVVGLSGQAWFEVVATLSTRAGRQQQLVYRFGTTPDSLVRVDAWTAHVFRHVRVGMAAPVVLTLLDDATAAFGADSLPADNALSGLALQVTALSGSVEVTLPRVGLPRLVTGQAAVDAVSAAYDQAFAAHPTVARRPGIEVSGNGDHHVGWYGAGATLVPFSDQAVAGAVATIHSGGGVASYNHPFGTASPARNAARIGKVFAAVAPSRVYGADVVELGYVQRGGMTLADHLALGDLLWQQGVVLTANGVSDDHNAVTWRDTFLTQLWTDGTPDDELAALRTGRATVARNGFLGDLAVTLDGRPMGSVPSSVVTATGELTVLATGLPAGATLEVVRGAVRPTTPRATAVPSTTSTVLSVDTALVGGAVSLGVAGGAAYHRVVARDASGSVLAFTNPVWSGVPDVSTVPSGRVVAV